MSSAVFTAIGVFTAFYNKNNRWVVAASFIAAVCLLFVACFLAWNEQFEKAKDYKQKIDALTKPELRGEIEFAALAPTNQGAMLMTLLVSIDNTGAPSIAKEIVCEVEINGKRIRGTPLLRPKGIVHLGGAPGKPAIEFSADDYLPQRVGYTPIATNGAGGGYVMSLIAGITKEQLEADVNGSLIVKFRDINGREYEVKKKMQAPSDLIDGSKLQEGMK